VLFRGRVILKQYIPKKQKMFWCKDLQNLRHEHMLGRGQAKCNTDDDDRDTCESTKSY
jgi:hypothetical protein